MASTVRCSGRNSDSKNKKISHIRISTYSFDLAIMEGAEGSVVVHTMPSGLVIESQISMVTRSLVKTTSNIAPFGRAYFQLLRARQVQSGGSDLSK